MRSFDRGVHRSGVNVHPASLARVAGLDQSAAVNSRAALARPSAPAHRDLPISLPMTRSQLRGCRCQCSQLAGRRRALLFSSLHLSVYWVANVFWRKVRTAPRRYVPQSRVRHDEPSIAVVAQVDRPTEGVGPIGQKVYRDPNGGGSQNCIRPDDLRAWPRMAVTADLLRKVPFVQKPKAPKTCTPRHREHYLPPHSRAFPRHGQYAQTNVHVWNQEPPRTDLQLAAILERIKAAENDVTGP